MTLLATPFNLKGHDIPSRCFFAPVNTGFAIAGCPTEALIEFHGYRSGREIGISYVGNVAIASNYVTNARTPYFSTELEAWERLVSTISRKGSVPGVQLACRASLRTAQRRWRHMPQTDMVIQLRNDLSALTDRELDEIVRMFGESARTAGELGFAVIQVHAAHGYLIGNMLNGDLNHRVDSYGSDPLLLLRRIIGATREAAPQAIIDVRLSVADGIRDLDREIADRTQQLDQIVGFEADMISLSAGSYEISRSLIYPARNDGLVIAVQSALSLSRSYPQVWWNAAGNIRSLSFAEEVPENLTISLGRPLIADPEFLRKTFEGRELDIKQCDWNGKCHYYTRGKDSITCPISPDLH